MNCKNYEKKILDVLDGKELPGEILRHITECQSCLSFHKYILNLKGDFNEIEKLEPSPDFDMKTIEKLKTEPIYLKILAFINSIAIFISISCLYLVGGKYFTPITIFCGKMLKILEILSEVFSYSFNSIAVLSFSIAIFFIISFGAFDILLLSKLIKNGGRL